MNVELGRYVLLVGVSFIIDNFFGGGYLVFNIRFNGERLIKLVRFFFYDFLFVYRRGKVGF